MTTEDGRRCLGLLMAIAFDGSSSKEQLQATIKGFLREEIPVEDVATVAGQSFDFSQYLPPAKSTDDAA